MKQSEEGVQSFLDSLPPSVRENVQNLRNLQKRCDTLKMEFTNEKRRLEEKYRALYAPVFTERAQIIARDTKENGQTGGPGAIPGFWVKVLKSMAAVREHVNKRDESVLKHLMDIRADKLEDGRKGFKLLFRFWPNEYFKEEELTKTYIMGDDDGAIVEKTVGCKISWAEGRNPGQKVLKKKAKGDGTPGMTKVKEIHSFFDFFSPPQLPESDEEDITVDEIAELHEFVEDDYEVGCLIRETLIPNAVSWYTGETMEEHGSELESGEEEAMECSSPDCK